MLRSIKIIINKPFRLGCLFRFSHNPCFMFSIFFDFFRSLNQSVWWSTQRYKTYLYFYRKTIFQRLSSIECQEVKNMFACPPARPIEGEFLTFWKSFTLWYLDNRMFERGNDHEVEFHEIKIQLFQEVKFSIMRSKFNLFMRSNLFINIWHFWSGGRHFDHEIEIKIMHYLAILISWLIC